MDAFEKEMKNKAMMSDYNREKEFIKNTKSSHFLLSILATISMWILFIFVALAFFVGVFIVLFMILGIFVIK